MSFSLSFLIVMGVFGVLALLLCGEEAKPTLRWKWHFAAGACGSNRYLVRSRSMGFVILNVVTISLLGGMILACVYLVAKDLWWR